MSHDIYCNIDEWFFVSNSPPMIRAYSSLKIAATGTKLGCSSFSTSSVALLNYGIPQNPAIDIEKKMTITPIKRTGETIDTKRARLVYQLRKRGILESDLLLSTFAKKHLNSFTLKQLDEYDNLLDETDWDIYYWATKNFDVTPLPDKWKDSEILGMLQEDAQNKDGVILRMPEL